VGSKEFMCIGATPPFDHPHVFIDMGYDTETICSYCSTLFKYDASLKADAARPATDGGLTGAALDTLCATRTPIRAQLATPVPAVELIEVTDLDETSRGTGGFGHTGH